MTKNSRKGCFDKVKESKDFFTQAEWFIFRLAQLALLLLTVLKLIILEIGW
jgi:hypothetical protein